MKRVTEPELMECPSQVRAYAEEDFSLSDNKFVLDLEQFLFSLGISMGEKTFIVDLGCGPGNISERLAVKWPSAKVIGIDGSKEMLRIANARREVLIRQNRLLNLSYINEKLDSINIKGLLHKKSGCLVVSNSLLHHIHDPSIFWEAIKRLSSVGSIQFHRDLRRPTSSDHVIALQQKYLPDSPKVLINDYVASLRASFTVSEINHQIRKADLVGLKVSEIDDRYLEITGTI